MSVCQWLVFELLVRWYDNNLRRARRKQSRACILERVESVPEGNNPKTTMSNFPDREVRAYIVYVYPWFIRWLKSCIVYIIMDEKRGNPSDKQEFRSKKPKQSYDYGKWECQICGSSVHIWSMSRHTRTKKHKARSCGACRGRDRRQESEDNNLQVLGLCSHIFTNICIAFDNYVSCS